MLLFVIGLPRSGTSLLYKTLCSHPEIELYYESDAYYSWPQILGAIPQKNWAQKLDFWNGHLTRMSYNSERLSAFPKLNKVSAMNYLYEELHVDGVKVVGEKSALYSSYLSKLSKDFPEAKFIILWRSLADVFDSVYRAGAGGDKYFSRKGLYYEYLYDLENLQEGVEFLKRSGKSVCEINFGDFIDDKEKNCKRVCDFLGIDYDVTMLTGKGFNSNMVPEGNHHSGVKIGVVDKSSSRGHGVSKEWSERISRYEARWQRLFKNTERNLEKSTSVEPSVGERIYCYAMFLLLKGRLHLTALLYWCLPKLVLYKFRS